MDDIAGKLSEILDSPEGMENLRSLAGSLLGGMNGSSGQDSGSGPSDSQDGPAMPSMSSDDMGTIMQLGSVLSKMGGQNDERTRLLLALRPHLTSERQERVDNAVKILKLVSVLPSLNESGLLSGLF